MEIRDDELDLYTLQHHGVKDQKWGVTHGPPYPLDKNAARQARKAEKAEQRKKQERAKQLAKARKTRQKNQKAKKKAAEKQAKEEEKNAKKRSKSLKNPNSMFKNRNRYDYTDEEVKNALAKFDWEQRVQNYSTTRLSNTAKKASDIVKLMTTGVGAYNTVAAAYNAWFPDDKQLPQINLNPATKKDDKKNDNQVTKAVENVTSKVSNPPKKSEGDSSASLNALRAVSEAALKKEEEKKKGK